MRTLLVVSDDPAFASAVRRELRTRMKTVAVRDGRQASHLMRQGVAPDVILLDSSPSCIAGWIEFVRENVHCTPTGS